MNHREAASFYVLVKKKRGSKGNRSYSFRNFAGEFIINANQQLKTSSDS